MSNITPEKQQPVQEPKKQEPKKQPPVNNKRQREEDEEEEYVRPRRRGFPPALIAIFAIIIFIVGVFYFLYTFIIKDIFTPDQEYMIPDLRGYTVEDIANDRGLLRGFGFEVQITISDSEYDAGEICRQYPVQNTTVKNPDTIIYVTVSTGEEEMFMPDVENMEAREAQLLLRNEFNLKIVSQIEEYSDEIAKGRVISSNPLYGTRVHKGDEVVLVISKGPEPILVNVLPFIDVDIEQVRSQMDSLGLTVGKVDEFYNDKYAAGRVIWQSISADTPVEPGTVIDFHVSKGPANGGDPNNTDNPEPTDDIPLPSEDVNSSSSERTVTVDLSRFSGNVHLLIVVGGSTIHDSTVDCTTVPSVTKTVYGSGVMDVFIYIDNQLYEYYELDFNA